MIGARAQTIILDETSAIVTNFVTDSPRWFCDYFRKASDYRERILTSPPSIPPGSDPGGGVLGVRTPPPLLGTPKLHKEGKNVVRVRANTPRFIT